MKIRKATNPDKVLEDIRTAIEKGRPVTLDYALVTDTGNLRTVELYEECVNKSGETYFRGMDRTTGLPRSWRMDRIRAYTVHRSSFIIPPYEPVPQAA